MTNAAWVKQGNTVVSGSFSPPSGFGDAFRIDMAVNTGGVYQIMTGLPVGRSVAAMAVKKGTTDYCVLKHTSGDFTSGAQGFFSFLTGLWVTSSSFGSVTDGLTGSRSLGGGWYLIWIAATISGNRIMEVFPTINGTEQIPAAGNSLLVCGAQYEDVSVTPKATYHKPTTSATVTRTLAAATVSFAISSIGAAQTVSVTAALTDSVGDPWDQFGPVSFASSDPTKATIGASTTSETDTSGRIQAVATGVATGTTSITATADTVTSAGVTLTVSGTAVARYIQILVEAGWQASSGWNVGVYEKHVSARFPTTKLFEVTGQSFNTGLSSGGLSEMIVPVPSGVSVSAAQVVEVVIENDNIEGRAVDGPGIFPAVVT
jgi:hypothetical protein